MWRLFATKATCTKFCNAVLRCLVLCADASQILSCISICVNCVTGPACLRQLRPFQIDNLDKLCLTCLSMQDDHHEMVQLIKACFVCCVRLAASALLPRRENPWKQNVRLRAAKEQLQAQLANSRSETYYLELLQQG